MSNEDKVAIINALNSAGFDVVSLSYQSAYAPQVTKKVYNLSNCIL